MRTAKLTKSLLMLTMALPLASCNSKSMGTIVFELNGGHFTTSNFTTKLQGESNTPIQVEFPTAQKDGYYFVGWREKRNGTYSEIYKSKLDDGTEAYLYPYGSTTLYAYFEEEKSITFDVGYSAASLVAPEEGKENFDATTKTLKGYVNKSILKAELPTATYDYASFQYWYTEYPLKTLTQEEGNVTYYVLDTSKEKGEYKFSGQFAMGGMVFPSYAEGENFVLHAKWSANPTVTLDFNVEGVENYSYQLKNGDSATFESVVKAGMKSALNTEYVDNQVIYNETKLAGLYADKKLEDKINLSQTIDTDTTIYFKWASKITVTFDYDGGTGSGDSIVAYQGDVLEESVLESHTPTKEGADFLYFTLDGNIYHFGTTTLPDSDCTLKASYSAYPVLTLSYAFASGLTVASEAITSKTYVAKGGSDISAYLDSFKNTDFEALNLGKMAKTLSYYTIQGKDEIPFQGTTMPGIDTTIYLGVGANAHVTYKTVDENADSHSIADVHAYCSDTDRITDVVFSDETNVHGITYVTVGSSEKEYIYGGLYSDISLDDDYKINEDRLGKTSEDEVPMMTIYREIIKGVLLTFVNESDTVLGSCYVEPGASVSEYAELFESIVGEGKTLTIDGKILSKSLPTAAETVLVK